MQTLYVRELLITTYIIIARAKGFSIHFFFWEKSKEESETYLIKHVGNLDSFLCFVMLSSQRAQKNEKRKLKKLQVIYESIHICNCFQAKSRNLTQSEKLAVYWLTRRVAWILHVTKRNCKTWNVKYSKRWKNRFLFFFPSEAEDWARNFYEKFLVFY